MKREIGGEDLKRRFELLVKSIIIIDLGVFRVWFNFAAAQHEHVRRTESQNCPEYGEFA